MSAQEDTAVIEAPEPEVEQPKAETPAAEVTTPETETPETAEEGQERDDKGRFKPNRVQERIDELTRKAGEKEREAAYWRGVAEAAKPKEAEAPKAAAGKPIADQFESYEAYTEALTDWKVDQKLAEREAKQQASAQATTWQQRAAAAKAELPDFEEVMQSTTAPMSPAMAEAIRDSEHGPALAYHLAKHPAEAIRLAGLSPVAAAREIGRLEATLSTPKAAAPAPAKRITTAPTPPTPIGNGRATVGDPGKMSQADYLAWRANALKVN